MSQRSAALDILRCVAVILIMFRHYHVTDSMTRAGWIGVDLFFVLSGFLVSGLLFREYKQTNKINGWRFLIRRGFKIYPAFWFVLGLHLIYFNYKGLAYTSGQLVSELLFVQNFFPGIIGISWTLAIEEHFYLFLVTLTAVSVRKHWLTNKKRMLWFCGLVFLCCLALRTGISFSQPFNEWTHFFPTYLRIDALMFGVLISWFFHFASLEYQQFISVHKWKVLGFSLFGLSLPFFLPVHHVFMNSAGLTILYLSFGGVLCLVLQLPLQAKGILWPFVYIGRYSYSIYLVHLIIGPGTANFFRQNIWDGLPAPFYAFISFTANILTGIIVSLLVEQFFLRVRDRYLPKIETVVDYNILNKDAKSANKLVTQADKR